MYGTGLAKSMWVTLRHLVRPPFTVQYPEERLPVPERGRSTLVWFEERCTGCNTCAEACPHGVIRVVTSPGRGVAGYRIVDEYVIDFRICMFCALCVEACPYDAIRTARDYEAASYDFGAIVADKEALNAARKRLEEGGLIGPRYPYPSHPVTAYLTQRVTAIPAKD
ncbi:MAG: NADH-quinone oxidoreductase subunit I [Chloroflexi bacterium]|nr:NADH-quinone oxidoreductase subunit I [Chloroflexota bacterium]